MNGNLTNITGNQVLIDGKGYLLAEHIQLKYVKVGQVSFSVDKVNPQSITFIKAIKDEGIPAVAPIVPQQPLGAPIVQPEKPEQTFNTDANKPIVDLRQKSIQTQFAIREGIRCIELNNALEKEPTNPTKNQIYNSAKIVLEVIDELMQL